MKKTVADYPELVTQWHPTKNGELKPSDISYGSGKKVWWKCSVADDHEWLVSPGQRTHGYGCPYCCGLKVASSNCLATTHPELCKEWHPTKNIDLTPNDITAGSHKKVWWKCPVVVDHEWEAEIKSRANGRGCPCCVRQKLVLSNCLATTHPELCKEWHPTKNGQLTPYMVTIGSHKKVWWICSNGHEWQTAIKAKGGCCQCGWRLPVKNNSLSEKYPNIAAEWHPTKNGKLSANDVRFGSTKKVWWLCPNGHEWRSSSKNRVRYYETTHQCGCRKCRFDRDRAGLVEIQGSLFVTHPSLAAQWHPTKNGDLTPSDITAGSRKKVWWKCPVAKDHEWEAEIDTRSNGSGCPCCINQKVVPSNCLANLRSDIAAQWHPTKNNDLRPEGFTVGSGRKIWWQCLVNAKHEWRTQIRNRTIFDNNCPFCAESKGEKKVAEFLDNHKITYKKQARFKSCVNIRPLPFDFAMKYNGKMSLIEYQGEQHYSPIGFGGDPNKNFERVKRNDKIKKNWCEQHGLLLLAIPYWDYDKVEQLIEEFLEIHQNKRNAMKKSIGSAK